MAAPDKSAEILEKIRNIETLLKLQDFQQKLIIQRLNNLASKEYEKREEKPVDNKVAAAVATEKPPPFEGNEIEEKKSELMKIEKRTPRVQTPVEDVPDFDFKIKIEKGKLGEKNEVMSATRIPVTQVVSIDGKPIVAAKIKIKNGSGDVIKDIQTNTSGRWLAPLLSGIYAIEVKGMRDNVMIEYVQSINVQETSAPIVVPMPEVYRKTQI